MITRCRANKRTMRDGANYRAEIDGLRAIAVLLVILFHFGIGPVQGGFVGVDVFFVISGYLITDILRREIEKTGQLDLATFFMRRTRRLLPALFVVIALSLAAGFLLMGAEHFEALSASALFATLGLSNVYFGQTTGYFDLNSDLKPLLHTWSLGVEMQFYLVWPLLLLASAKLLGRVSPIVVIGVGILSLVACLDWERSSTSIYYLPQFRVFEFAIGAALLWAPPIATIPKQAQEIMTASGLLLIVCSALLFNEQTPFPGTNAILPCVGAAMVIYAGRASKIGAVLRNSVATGIGKISYSLYLVHWPAFVFYRYYRFEEISAVEVSALLAFTLAASILLYFVIEKPFRRTGAVGWRAIIGFLVAALALVTPSGLAWAEHGLPFRVPGGSTASITGGYAQCDYPVCTFGETGTVDFVVVGDSHARHLYAGLERWAEKEHLSFAVFHFDPYCRLINAPQDNKTVGYDCPARLRQFFDFVVEKNVRHLIFAHRWRDAPGAANITDNPVAKQIVATLSAPELSQIASVAIVLNVPEFYENRTPQGCLVPGYLVHARDCELVSESASFYAQIRAMNVALARQIQALVPGALIIDPFDVLCDGDQCRQERGDDWFYSDAHHLSDIGADLLVEGVESTLASMMQANP